MTGLTNQSFQISGIWVHSGLSSVLASQYLNTTRRICYSDTVRWLGVDWWTYRREFDATLVAVGVITNQHGEEELDTQWKPSGPVTEHTPEWWRRYGHAVAWRVQRWM